MRPISIKSNIIRYPLDFVLGSEAHVRLLRLLINEVDSTLSAADAARRTGLTPAGARKALGRLQESGVVYRTGGGRNVQYGFKNNMPLSECLRQLFSRELEQYDLLIMSIQRSLGELDEICEAWIEELPTETRSAIEITLVTETKTLSWMGDELRSRLSKVEKEFDLIIETTLYTRADAQSPPQDSLTLKSTGFKQSTSTAPSSLSHADAEKRSLLVSQGIANLIRSDPSLVNRAKHYLNRMMRDNQGNAVSDLAEWRNLLDIYTPDRISELLVSDSSRANRLRQSSPFFAILTAGERDKIIASMESQRD